MLRIICKRHLPAAYLSGKECEKRIYRKGPNTVYPGRRTCILPNYFGSFCGKSVESREERRVVHMSSSHNSCKLRSAAAGRQDLCGPGKMLCPYANTHDFNLRIVSHFRSSWSTSDHSSTVLIQQMANRWLNPTEPQIGALLDTGMFFLSWTAVRAAGFRVCRGVPFSFMWMCHHELSPSSLGRCWGYFQTLLLLQCLTEKLH